MTGGHAHGAPPPPSGGNVSAQRLILTLGGAGAFAGALILVAFTLTEPVIEGHRARRLDQAVTEVLRGPARYDTLYVVAGKLTARPPAGQDPRSLERLYLGHAADGSPVGYAIVGQTAGFADAIRLIFGYDAATGTVIGMKVLESKETPGLGDKIEKDTTFTGQFGQLGTPLLGVKIGAGKGAANEVDLITGATISSRAVVKIINDALARLGPALAAGPEAP